MSESDALIIRVNNKDLGELTFKVKKSTRISKVFKIYAEQNNVQESDLQFFIRSRNMSGTSNETSISGTETAQSLQLEDEAIIECAYSGPAESDALIISVRNKELGETMLKLKKSTRMSKVFKAYADHNNVRESELQFFINGSRNVFRCNSRRSISGTETVQSLHLEDGAIIKCSYKYNPNLRTILVRRYTGEELKFWVKEKESTEMRELFEKYVEVLATDHNKTVELSTLRFFFNEKLISETDTCQSLQLKDDDRIDCYTRFEILSLECGLGISFSALLEQIIDSEPSSVRYLDARGRTLLAKACGMRGVDSLLLFEVVQLLLDAWPEALIIVDHLGCLPIHHLCCNIGLDDSTSIRLLHLLINSDALLRSVDDIGFLPIHHAVFHKSAKFCKELLALCPETVRAETIIGLPIHIATGFDRVNVQLEDTYTRIAVSVIELLLECDPSGASAPDAKQRLPLHVACTAYYEHLPVVKCLFDDYPEAIWAIDEDGNTPLDLARKRENKKDPNDTTVIGFLEDQLKYVTEDMVLDGNCQTFTDQYFGQPFTNVHKMGVAPCLSTTHYKTMHLSVLLKYCSLETLILCGLLIIKGFFLYTLHVSTVQLRLSITCWTNRWRLYVHVTLIKSYRFICCVSLEVTMKV